MAAGGRPMRYHGGLLGSMYCQSKKIDMSLVCSPTLGEPLHSLSVRTASMSTPHKVSTTRPGRFHNNNAMSPPKGPARLSAVEITSCVLVGPGRPCDRHNETKQSVSTFYPLTYYTDTNTSHTCPIAKSSVNCSSSNQSRCTTK